MVDADGSKPLDEQPLIVPPKMDWMGQWIWSTDSQPQRNAYAYFRQEFVSDHAGTLVVEITADSFYWLHLDGCQIGRGPARAHLDAYGFDRYEVPVSAGRHCVAVTGHHIGEQNASVMTGRAGVLADVQFLDDAGSRQDLSTGPAWRCRPAPAWRSDLACMMSHFGFWEECDLREMPYGWALPGFDDHAWQASSVVGIPPCPPWRQLCPRDIPMPQLQELDPVRWVARGCWKAGAEDPIPSKTVAARKRESLPPQASGLPQVFAPEGDVQGQYVTVDFGRTVSGYVELTFAQSQPGQVLEISYDDLTDAQGVVNPERSYAHLTDRYILPGGRCQLRTMHPRGFRYLMLDLAGGGTLEKVVAIEETYPFVLQPAFRSNDPALETFFGKAAESVRICTTDAFTDCATRERVQWTEDLYMHSQVAAYAFADTCMLRRALFQSAQNALPDGRINGFFPSERTNCAFAGSSIVWLHLLADYLLYDGHVDFARLLPTARKLITFIEGLRDEGGLIASWPAGQFWDWAPIEGSGCMLLTNAAYVVALTHLSRQPLLADALGIDLVSAAHAIRQAAHARFWDAARGLYRDAQPAEGLTPIFSQHANAMAVLAGICPEANGKALLERITDPARLGPIPVGEDSLKADRRPSPDQIVPVGTLWFAHFVVRALFENGLDRQALAQMRMFWGAHDDLPVFPETRIQQGNTFLCHGWAGGPAYLLPAYVLGVKPTAPGWSVVNVNPHPGDLQTASGTLHTPLGPLTVSWRKGHDGLELDVQAPEGMRIQRQAVSK